MKSRTKLLTAIVAILLSMVIVSTTVMVIWFNAGKSNVVSASTRTVELSEMSIDTQSIFDGFEDVSLTQEGNVTYFSGYKTVDKATLSDLDYISESSAETEEAELYFEVSVDGDNANVTLNVVLTDEDEETIVLDDIQGIAMDGEDGSLEVWYIIDGELVSQQDILALEYETLDNVGLLSWLKSLVSAVKNIIVSAVISTLIDVATVAAAVLEIAANYGVASSGTATSARIESNYANNLKQTFSVVTSGVRKNLINTQNTTKFSKWLYGNGYTIADKGCGVIATYNVLIYRNKISTGSTSGVGNTEELAKIVKNYESAFGTILGGVAGTNPLHISPYLTSCGLSVTTYKYTSQSSFVSKCNSMSTSQIAVLCYFYKTDNSIGMHYITIIKTSGTLYLVNKTGTNTYTDIGNFLSSNTFVYGWIVK